VWGNNIFDYEASWPGKLESGVHRALGQLAGILVHEYPTIRIYPDGLSQRDLDGLTEGRDEFLMAAFAVAIALAVFGTALFRMSSSRSRQDTNGIH